MGLERGGVFSDGRSGCAIVSNLLLTQLDKHVLDAGDSHERLEALSQGDMLALFELFQQSCHLAINADIDLERVGPDFEVIARLALGFGHPVPLGVAVRPVVGP